MSERVAIGERNCRGEEINENTILNLERMNVPMRILLNFDKIISEETVTNKREAELIIYSWLP